MSVEIVSWICADAPAIGRVVSARHVAGQWRFQLELAPHQAAPLIGSTVMLAPDDIASRDGGIELHFHQVLEMQVEAPDRVELRFREPEPGTMALGQLAECVLGCGGLTAWPTTIRDALPTLH